MRLFAFQGTRYSAESPDPGALAAPPYDQIDEGERQRLQALDRHHFAHLSRPHPTTEISPADHAARLHRDWRERGIVTRDEEPSLYPYEIRLAEGGRRLGVYAMVGLEEPESGVIRPHEQTITKTVEERLELLRRTEVDLGPVLLLAEDAGALDELLTADLEGASPLAEHRDAFGHLHRLFRLTDPTRLAAYRDAVREVPGLIADGHHRYKTARLFAREASAATGTAAAGKLCAITSLASPALTIEPIHRALGATIDPAADGGVILRRVPSAAAGGAQLAREVAAAEQPALGAVWADGRAEIWHLDPTRGPRDLPPAASDLAVVLLHRTLMPAWGMAPEASTDGTVLYRSDPDQLYEMVTSGGAATGFFLPPMSTSGFAAAIADGDVLPPKSTRFMPKVVSGLVWAEHAARTT